MIQVLIGDALEKLRELPSESVQCCVTSPPYWGLRDYSRCSCSATYDGGPHSGYEVFEGHLSPRPKLPDPNCPICHGTGIIEGVKEHQLGLEKTPEEYVQHLVEVFREVKRVLRDDGTLWLVIGDSYAGSGTERVQQVCWGRPPDRTSLSAYPDKVGNALKPKDLVGIPWRVAFALQADGWYLRSDIIWSKPNPMPESIRDRPTKSHEYIFLLTKSARYFYDQEAVREEGTTKNMTGWNITDTRLTHGSMSGGNLGIKGLKAKYHELGLPTLGRNIHTVWEITTQPYPEAHFATFPEELPKRCIKAGTSRKGCCPKCGAPWERVVEKNRPEDWEDSGLESEKELALSQGRGISLSPGRSTNPKLRSISDIFGRATKSKMTTLGWQPTCGCNELEPIPCTVLDPFAGSGTSGWVARSLGRKAILIELNPLYGKLIEERAKTNIPDLLSFESEEEIETQLGDGTVNGDSKEDSLH